MNHDCCGCRKHQYLDCQFRLLLCLCLCRYTATMANICRQWLLFKAYIPIRSCRLRKLKGDWRQVTNKMSTSLIAAKIVYTCENLNNYQTAIVYHLRLQTCDPFDPPWRKCPNIFAWQLMAQQKHKKSTVRPMLYVIVEIASTGVFLLELSLILKIECYVSCTMS